LVPKSQFYDQRDIIKQQLKHWAAELDPEDTREYRTPPEVAHISKDDFSSDAGSYFTHSIASILTFEVDEVVVRKEQQKQPSEQETLTATTPSELSIPPVIRTNMQHDSEVTMLREQVDKYQKDIGTLTARLDTMSAMLELLLKKVEGSQELEECHSSATKKDRRQRLSDQDR